MADGARIPPWDWTHIMVTHSPTYRIVTLYINNVAVGSGTAPLPHNTTRADCHS